MVRLWLTNTANTRVFNVGLPGARMKLVGGDSGRVEHEEFVSEVVLAPSERAVVDVLFDQPGQLDAGAPHPGPDLPARRDHRDRRPRPRRRWPSEFEVLRARAGAGRRAAAAGRAGWPRRRTRSWRWSPRWTTSAAAGTRGRSLYACPMHPEVTSEEPGRCPKCGMKLLATQAPAVTAYACPMHPEVTSDQPGRCPECGMKLLATAAAVSYAVRCTPTSTSQRPTTGGMEQRPAWLTAVTDHAADGHSSMDDQRHGPQRHGHGGGEGIEWEDDMVEVNRLTTPANMHWKFVDRTTGAANAAIDWRFTVGDRVKIRLVNEMDSDHPMHHPFHLHGAGRFLVLARDGVSRAQPGLEGHRAGPHRADRGHPVRRHQPRAVDGALPHRRAHAKRHDVQLHRGPRRERAR